MSVSMKSRSVLVICFGVLVAVVAVFRAAIFKEGEPDRSAYGRQAAAHTTERRAPAAEPAPRVAQPVVEEAQAIENPEAPAPAEIADEDPPEPTNYYNGRDPEHQPRKFLAQDLGETNPYAAGFIVTGDDVLLTDEGWSMAPPEPGQKIQPRSIMFESPVITLDFPANSLTSLWKEISPEGTEVLIEVAASPDGEHWTTWYPTTGAHMDGEISPTYPDGRPNPNYGYTQGDTVFFGVGLYYYMKYSIMLYSEVEASPTVLGFRLFYQDSTMGDGHLVEYQDDTPPELREDGE